MEKELMFLCRTEYKTEFNDGCTDYFDYEENLQKIIEGDGRVVCFAEIEAFPDGQLRHPDNIRQARR